MKVLCVIPARLASTRLPRKPLQLLGDKPIIQHTYEGAKSCHMITKLLVATDTEEIADVVHSFGGEAIITDPNLSTGSDRVAMVARQFPDMNVVINLQGDEPFIRGEMLCRLLEPYQRGEAPDMATLGFPINFKKNYANPDKVKVIYDKNGYAIYFSRAPIPYFRIQTTPVPVLHHMGVYAFRFDFLQTYTHLSKTQLEQAELLEQLRALEYGYKIKVCKLPAGNSTIEINTPEELELAQNYLLTRKKLNNIKE